MMLGIVFAVRYAVVLSPRLPATCAEHERAAEADQPAERS